MKKHAMKRITFDSFKSLLDYLCPNIIKDVFIDTFGPKSLCLVSYLGSVRPFWILDVIFENALATFGW